MTTPPPSRADPGSDRASDTRARVLEVAARHFAEHSFQGVSLRAIQREVGVNPATVNYHFGTKEALYQAVIGQFLEGVQAERLARLAGIPAGLTPRARLEALITAYLSPHFELAATPAGYHYARILAFVQVNPRDAASDLFNLAVSPVRNRFVEELGQLFPDCRRRQLFRVLAMAVAHMAMAPIWLQEAALDADRMAAEGADTIAFCAAGIERLCGPLAA